ncbi:MAG: N-(5phosphoribosyl)anthranilate isomerase [Pseudomonadota bacterium]|jgi:phosphoribosylanthranilate isomerase
MQFRYPSRRTRVKICGITRVEDADQAVAMGADALGLVFYSQSPRNVSLAQAKAITEAVPAFVTVVGLFVNPEPDLVASVLSTVPVDLLQFHGDEDAAFCGSFCRPYIKALRMEAHVDPLSVMGRFTDAKALLLDAYHAGARGGTGESFDWARVPAPGSSDLPVILAGGLDAANVRRALEQTQVYAVDVSSGVELGRGIKDHDKVASFIREVREFDNGKWDCTLQSS